MAMANFAKEVGFIRDDEHILLMEDSMGGVYGLDDLKRLRDAGIQTIIRYPYWKDIETSLGHYEWGKVDDQIDMTRQAGMKCMFALYEFAPHFFLDDWYLKYPDRTIYQGSFYDHVISPWSEKGWDYHLAFLGRFCERVCADDVLTFRATIHGGEVMMPEFAPYRQDGDLLKTFERMIVEEQRIFSHYNDDLWTCFHHAFDHLPYSGTVYANYLRNILLDEFPTHNHYCISYTQFRDDVIGEDKNLEDMKTYHLKMFGGSEYAEGLITNTDKAISQGFRGFVTAPLHYYSGHKKLEDWMIEAVQNSLRKWNNV
jgi:hypothetical protein